MASGSIEASDAIYGSFAHHALMMTKTRKLFSSVPSVRCFIVGDVCKLLINSQTIITYLIKVRMDSDKLRSKLQCQFQANCRRTFVMSTVIKMYCGRHDVVCCLTCIAVKHRTCEGVEYIPDILKGLLNTDDKKKVKESLENMKDDLNRMKSKIKNEIKLLNQKRDAIIDDVHAFKRHIMARVEEIEKQSLKDV